MICCLGLIVGFLLGQYLGVGSILALTGFATGLVGDITVFRFLRGRQRNGAKRPYTRYSVEVKKRERKAVSCC